MEVARRRGDAQTLVERSQPYDVPLKVKWSSPKDCLISQGAGADAEAGNTPTSPAAAWLIAHAADLPTECSVGADSRTPYERLKANRQMGDMYEFGPIIDIQLKGKPEGESMQPGWVAGIWLGKIWASDEHVVAMFGGKIARVREMIPEVGERAFDAGLFNGIAGIPDYPGG